MKKKSKDLKQIDNTDHVEAFHEMVIPPHTKEWYSTWGNKCPVCKQSANIVYEEVK